MEEEVGEGGGGAGGWRRRAVPAAGAAGRERVKARSLYDNELPGNIGREAGTQSTAAAAAAGAGAARRSGVLASREREGGWAQLLGILQPGGQRSEGSPRELGRARAADLPMD